MIKTTSLAIAAILISVMPLAAAPFHHPFGEWREYSRDWLAACPDVIDEDAADYYGFSCFASTGSVELNDANLPAYKMTLLLNRLNGDLDISFSIQADGLIADPTHPLKINFPGQAPLAYNFFTDLETRYNIANQFYLVDPLKRDALLELMKKGTIFTLTVPIDDADNPTRDVPLSLHGVTASLDFMHGYARRVAQY